jgi:drug/metabolite transporter (DMT)-like permease
VGIFASIVAFILWNSAVVQIGPIRSSVFLNLIPVFATFFAVLFNNEMLAGYQIIGGVVVILGVYLSTIKKAVNEQLRLGEDY